jgi:outer membrane lipoprotein-sorting protein
MPAVAILTLLCALVQQGAGSTAYEQLLSRITGARSIACTAVSTNRETVRIIATRQGKFRIETAKQLIISNGTIVWNYSPSTNTVTVTSASQQTTQNILHVVQTMSQRYRITTKSATTVTLRPSDGTPYYGIEQLALGFRAQRLISLTITRAGQTERWQIRSLEFDRLIPDTVFVFTPPPDVEVVDMR